MYQQTMQYPGMGIQQPQAYMQSPARTIQMEQPMTYQNYAPQTQYIQQISAAPPGHPTHIGRAEGAKEKVHYMHQQMQEVEETISQLQSENVRLKTKLLMDRRATLEKYFMADGHLLKQAVLGEWKRIMEVLRRMREIDGLENIRAEDRAAYEQRAAELEEQLKETNAAISSVEAEKQDIQQRADMAEAKIRRVGEQMARYPLGNDVPKIPAYENEQFLKSKMHQLLKDIDPNYIVPMAGEPVIERAPAQTTYVSSRPAQQTYATVIPQGYAPQQGYAAPQTYTTYA